jgi:hypothetical protein
MDCLQFIAALASALAWPATVVTVVFVLRHPILKLIPALHKLKLKEFEIEFREKLAEAAKAVATIATSQLKEPDVALLKPPDYYRDLARISPRAALMEVWMEIETAAADAFHRRFSKSLSDVRIQPKDVLAFLRSHDVISEDDHRRADDLRQLRNRAAHQVEISEISSELIDAYITLALDLARKLKKI